MLLSLIGLVVAGAFLLGKRGGRLDAMRADAAVCCNLLRIWSWNHSVVRCICHSNVPGAIRSCSS